MANANANTDDRHRGNSDVVPALLDARGVAVLLAVSVRTVWALNSTGRLPKPLRLPGTRCVRWRVDELRAWLAAGCPVRDRWEALRTSDK